MKKLTKAGITLAAASGVACAGKYLYDRFDGKDKVMNIVDMLRNIVGRRNEQGERVSHRPLRERLDPYAAVPEGRRNLVRKIMSMLPMEELEESYSPKDVSDLFDSEKGQELLEKLENYRNVGGYASYREMSDDSFLTIVTHSLIDIADAETKMDIMLEAAQDVLIDGDEPDYEDEDDYDDEMYGCGDYDYEDYE